MENRQLKKYHVQIKTIWHCVVGAIECIGIPLFLAYLSTFLSPFTCKDVLWQWIERTAFCFTIYEVVVIGIRKMQVDTRKDALLALKTAYEKGVLCCESENENIKKDLRTKIDRVLDTSVLNQLDIINSYNNLLKYIESKNIVAMKNEIISIQHTIEASGLLWNYTLLLRLLKG